MFPPTRGSNFVSTIGAPRRLCSFGLMSSNCSTNAANARSCGTSSVISRRTTVFSSFGLMGLLGLFSDGSKVAQRLTPEGVELIPKRKHSDLIEAVDASRPVSLLLDEARVFEHLEMLGHSRPTDRKSIGKLADRAGRFGEEHHDGATRPISERIPHPLLAVSFHERLVQAYQARNVKSWGATRARRQPNLLRRREP